MFRRLVESTMRSFAAIALACGVIWGCGHNLSDYAGDYKGPDACASIDGQGRGMLLMACTGSGYAFQLTSDGKSLMSGVRQLGGEQESRARLLDGMGAEVAKEMHKEAQDLSNSHAEIRGDRLTVWVGDKTLILQKAR